MSVLPRTRRWRTGARALGGLLLVAGLLLSGCILPRHPIASARVLADIAAGNKPSALKRRTSPPEESVIHYSIEGRSSRAFLFIPRKNVQAGIVLAPGAAELGAEDPRLVAFARTLARAQFAVLVPDIEEVRRFELGTNNIHALADALRFMASRPDLSPEGRLGIAALSYAVGPAILAAVESDLRDQVAFVVGVGGYYDLVNVVTYFTTGYFREPGQNGRWQKASPSHYGAWIFVLTNVGRLTAAADRRVLEEMAARRLNDPDAPIESLARQLGPEGRSYYELLMNRDPQRVAHLLAQLPEPLLDEFNALNLAQAELSHLRAKLLLFHGRNDPIIPYTESIRLAEAVGHGEVELSILNGLDHVNVGDLGLGDRLKLWHGIDALLRQRSR